MTLGSILALFSTMFVLAIIPSPSVFAVVSRSMASGFLHGAMTTAGIVTGDILFILLALLGLWTVAEAMDGVFALVKYLGSAYLIYLGIVTLRTKPRQQVIEAAAKFSWFANFLGGLFITLSDPKAILFYAGFLPAYLDLSNLSVTDITLMPLGATIAVGGAKLVYAFLADKARFLLKRTQIQVVINAIAGMIMIATGVFLAIKA